MIFAIEAPKNEIIASINKALSAIKLIESKKTTAVVASTTTEGLHRSIQIIKNYFGEIDDEWVFIRPGASMHESDHVKAWRKTGYPIPDKDDAVAVAPEGVDVVTTMQI